MNFRPTGLPGAYIIEIERREDERGFFARSWCQREFGAHGLNPRLVQCNISFNPRRGTMRGMHYQRSPWQEAKLVRCTRGAICDAIVDMRSDSPTFMHHIAVNLTADQRNMLYVPEGFAHGFLTLENDTEVFYQMSEYYMPEAACGFRWNDPAVSVDWPIPVEVISERDAAYPDLVRT